MEKMKDRLKKSSPKIYGRANLENINQIKNFMFGKKKGMGVDDDVKGISVQKAKQKIADSKNKKPVAKKDTRLSPGALGGKIKPAAKKDIKTKPVINKEKKKIVKKNKKKDPKSKVKATASNTKGFASTMAMQKRLIAKGAKINADGIMGAKTRAAMAKFMKAPEPKLRPKTSKTMVDSFKKSNVSANKNKNAGTDGARGDNNKIKKRKSIDSKLNLKGKYKGTNVTPTKSQLEDLKRRRARASST